MNKAEFKEVVEAIKDGPLLDADDVARGDRTLLWGRGLDRGRVIHVYLKDRVLHRVVLESGGKGWVSHHEASRLWHPDRLATGQVWFPEFCDAEFCHLLLHQGVRMQFPGFNPERWEKRVGEGFQGAVCDCGRVETKHRRSNDLRSD